MTSYSILWIVALFSVAAAGAAPDGGPTLIATLPRPICRSDHDGCIPELALLDAGNISFWLEGYRKSWSHMQVGPVPTSEGGGEGSGGGLGRAWLRAALGMPVGAGETEPYESLSPTQQRAPVKLLLAKVLKGWRAGGSHLNAVEIRDADGQPVAESDEMAKLASSKAAGRALVGGHTISFFLEEFPKAVGLGDPATLGLWGLTREITRLTGHLVTAQLDIGTENQHRTRSPIAYQHDSWVWQLHGSSVWTICAPGTLKEDDVTATVASSHADRWMLQAIKKRHDDSNHEDVTMMYQLEEIEELECTEMTVNEGGVLYLPFGAVHQVHPSGSPSVTLRAGLLLPGTRYIDVLNHAAHSFDANGGASLTDAEQDEVNSNANGFSDAIQIASRQFYGLVFWLPIAGLDSVAAGTATPGDLANIAASAKGMLDVVEAALAAFFKSDAVTPPKMRAGVRQVRGVDWLAAVTEFGKMVAVGTKGSLDDPVQYANAMRSRRHHNNKPPYQPPTDGDGDGEGAGGAGAGVADGDDQGFSPADGMHGGAVGEDGAGVVDGEGRKPDEL